MFLFEFSLVLLIFEFGKSVCLKNRAKLGFLRFIFHFRFFLDFLQSFASFEKKKVSRIPRDNGQTALGVDGFFEDGRGHFSRVDAGKLPKLVESAFIAERKLLRAQIDQIRLLPIDVVV